MEGSRRREPLEVPETLGFGGAERTGLAGDSKERRGRRSGRKRDGRAEAGGKDRRRPTAVGRFADMWGRKLLYVYGFVVFTVASVLCGLAPGLGWLCGFRALQAVGAAMLQANSLAVILLVVPFYLALDR